MRRAPEPFRPALSGRRRPVPAAADLDLVQLPRAQLERMAAAGRIVSECERVLAKTGDTVVDELLRGQGDFFEWDHYPPGEVRDAETGSLYYYHAHAPEGRDPDEHGHFHAFLNLTGLPAEIRPLPIPGMGPAEVERKGFAHLIAIAMDRQSRAYRLFTTNRWVTGESWYRAGDLLPLIERFDIGHARPSWPLNRWLTGMLALFRPQIAALLEARDRAILSWARRHPRRPATEDRQLEIVSSLAISPAAQLRWVEAALAASAGRQGAGERP